jgi:hypothetical protein
VRTLAAMVLVAAAVAPTASLGRLADAVAAEVLRAAGGRAVELGPFEDRTGSGATAADLQSLVAARLEGHLAVPGTAAGARLTVTSVVVQSGPRLVWSARLLDESGALVDVLSVSTTWDPDVLPLVPAANGGSVEGVDVLEHATTPPLEGRIVALAFSGDERLLVLFEDALALYHRDGLALRLEARRDLPGPLAPVRFPGGLLLTAEKEGACWAITSRAPRAVLFTIEGSRLTPMHQADALPWPRLPAGVRFRAGTNLLEVSTGDADAPVVALEPDEGWSVRPEGSIVRAGGAEAPGPRAGPALARLWPGMLAAASPDPPGEHDRILLLREREADGDLAGTVPVDGAVRALAARRQGHGALLAAALESAAGGFRIGLFTLGERR